MAADFVQPGNGPGTAPLDWNQVAVMELVTALRWYAERRNYRPSVGESEYDAVTARDSFDGDGPGARARHALNIWERDRV